MTSVTIPNSVTFIGQEVFNGCSGLTSVTIPNSVTRIGSYAFSRCSGLTSVTIPNSVTSIGKSAFIYCSGLTSVTIPNSVTSIGEHAFYGCSGLTSVHITDLASWCEIKFDDYTSSPLSYAHHLFMNGEEIKNLVIPNSVTSIGDYAFYNCSGLTSVTIPNSVTSIGESAFYLCFSLAMLTLPENIKIIKKETFAGCAIKSIVIPAKVEYIYAEAFSCSGTQEVKVLAETPPFAYDNTFSNYNVPLYVPSGSTDAYQSTNPWSKFSSLKTLSGEDIEVKICSKPTICYKNGKLTFNSETEGAICQYTITDSDIKTGSGTEVQLSVTYNISVYAEKSGYQNSDVATATLCWIDKEPSTEGITDGVAQIPSKAVLIQSEGGILKVEGIDDGTQVAVYTPDGKQAGSAVSRNGAALVGTNIQPGNTAIVKIGEKTVKVIMK